VTTSPIESHPRRTRCPRLAQIPSKETKVRNQTATVLYVVVMVAVIVAIDVAFFRDRFWERLTVNVGIILVFAAFYFRFLKGR
jgi:hypothetical protein